MNSTAHIAAAEIQKQHPNFKPRLGIVLGSGLGAIATKLDNAKTISYQQLAGFPRPTVLGHSGNLVLGKLHGIDIVCLQGRSHAYEGTSPEEVKTYVRALKLLGCEYFFATNASGSLREDVGPGELMLISDHINMQPGNPLTGPNDDEFGPRFYPLDNAYDRETRHQLLQLAEREHIRLQEGVYLSVLGPNYETAAEIRAFRMMGADAVGMSTVPEVLVANHCGMKVAVIATITNYATGLNKESHRHEAVIKMAEQASEQLIHLIDCFVASLK